ncbi:hypothetical protein BU26DRAFT_573009 [Trematosphaeria pertusa]|uniref:Uncharacterized protein n=1 Tax=Trematosphaeria pertusa TaxID=390896 RepID=A0A6A6HQR8_9PLEO|nr:uncharacterized protein BU26DRAFT_573009 [Trematosphaeria pertusa]KAF2240219.1 hypothetical protein BU26DRAFT_573009 [Trematosphaeria pertusa]
MKKSCTIKTLGPCVEMPRQSSGRLRKDGKPYRFDLYVRVEYHTDPQKNPDAKRRPIVEWLTRTELVQLVGKKYEEKQEIILMAKYKKRQSYFNECKKRRLHLETKNPLSARDYDEYPWLFLDDGAPRPSNRKQTEDDDGDEEMTGVRVDGEDDEDFSVA